MIRHRAASVAAALALALGAAGVAGCSAEDEPRTPSGGINGPARVEPNPGADNPVDGTDE